MENEKKHVDKEIYRKAIIELTSSIENTNSLKRIYDYIYRSIKRADN